MKKQVAKTKVFTKERMEQLQDVLHSNAELLIGEHPEIFGDETLKPKERGRNSDMSKDYYIKMKQQQYEELQTQIDTLEVKRDTLNEENETIAKETEKLVNSAIDQIVDTEMKKEFMRYALLDNPKSTLGKMISGVFKKFKELWEREEKPKVKQKVRESVLAQLRLNKKAVETNQSMGDNKRNAKEYER